MKPSVDFATFVYSGDAHRLYAPGQFRRQVESNCYPFNKIIVVHQKTQPANYPPLEDLGIEVIKPIIVGDMHINKILTSYGIDITRPQYSSDTDKHHQWKHHVVNHLCAASVSEADYIVFADNDCWMKEPINWIDKAIETLKTYPDCFLVSPNDGEPERKTWRMSQQMFMVRLEDFKKVNWNQPGFTGNVRDYDTMPQYHAMGEGRLEYYCRSVGKYRYVLEPKYRYYHWNRTNAKDLFEIDPTKY